MDAISTDGKIWTINTKNTTYQFMKDEFGTLIHLYYGEKTKGSMEFLLNQVDRAFAGNIYETKDNRRHSYDTLPMEFPVNGNGDFRNPCFEIKYDDTTWGTDLRFSSYKISSGKYSIPKMPAVYENSKDENAQTLEIVLIDTTKNVEVTLLYGVLPEIDIITRSVKVKNLGPKNFTIEKIQSAAISFLSGEHDILKFYGRHAMERNVERSPIGHGSMEISSRRGTSSLHYNPCIIIADKQTTDSFGNCWGMNFVFSGNFKIQAEKDQINQTRIQLGLNDELFSYPLKPGEIFHAPEVILTFSSFGFNSLSQNFHKCIKNNICRGPFKLTHRPVLINSWEANYFDFDGKSIINLAEKAASLGIEMLVLDDGWFGKRNNDCSGLGDWIVNEKKLGMSLKTLTENINKLGLKFGIWFEPEMISEDSDLYRNHPDFVLKYPNKQPIVSRYQLVLDFSRADVREYIFNQICNILDNANIDYIKWDMNRALSDIYSNCTNNQGTVMFDYVLGVYETKERLLKRYPNLLIEGCSSGGGRFDAGMLYYTPQIWTSDNTDAIDRTRIQYGTSFGYPVTTMGNHVSICPNHQTQRSVPIETRGTVAMGGAFGYELDLFKLSQEEISKIKEQVEYYKENADFFISADYYRLTNPFTDEIAAWAFISPDKKKVIINGVILEFHGNMPNFYIKIQGLKDNSIYIDKKSGTEYPSRVLKNIGLPLKGFHPQYSSFSINLELL